MFKVKLYDAQLPIYTCIIVVLINMCFVILAQAQLEETLIVADNVAELEQLYLLEQHASGVTSLATNGSTLVSSSFGQTDNLIEWDLLSSTNLIGTNFPLFDGDVASVDINQDGSTMLTGSVVFGSYLMLTDLDSGEVIYDLEGHRYWVLSVAISNDGTRGLSGSADTNVFYWNLETGEPINMLTAHRDVVWTVAISPDGTLGASGSCNRFSANDEGQFDCVEGSIIIWDLVNGEILHEISAHNERLSALEFNNDGTQLLSGGADGRLFLWDTQSGGLIRQFQNNSGNAHDGTIRSISLNPSNDLVVSGATDGNLRIWSVSDGELLRTIVPNETGNSIVFSTAFAENFIAAGIENGDIYIYGLTE